MGKIESFTQEQDNQRSHEAFSVTRILLGDEIANRFIEQGLSQYFDDYSKVAVEMNGINSVLERGANISVFKKERGVAYMLWSMIEAEMRQDPYTTSARFEDGEFLKEYLETLPQRIHEAYLMAAGSSI